MRIYKILIFAIVGYIICSGFGCNEHSKTYTIRTDNLIASYTVIGNIYIVQEQERLLKIRCEGSGIYYSSTNLKIYYDQLCEKHSDTDWNLNFQYENLIESYIPIAQTSTDFVTISIITKDSFNSSHPAGSALNDIVRFMSGSTYPFIKSKYSKPYMGTQTALSKEFMQYVLPGLQYIGKNCYAGYFTKTWGDGATPYYPVDKLCSQLTVDDLTLLGAPNSKMSGGNLAYLYFEETPDVLGDYEIIIELVGDDGKTYKTSQHVIF